MRWAELEVRTYDRYLAEHEDGRFAELVPVVWLGKNHWPLEVSLRHCESKSWSQVEEMYHLRRIDTHRYRMTQIYLRTDAFLYPWSLFRWRVKAWYELRKWRFIRWMSRYWAYTPEGEVPRWSNLLGRRGHAWWHR